MWVTNRPPRRGTWRWRHHGHIGTAARRDFTVPGYPSRERRVPCAAPSRPAPQPVRVMTPAMEERIIELMPEDAKAALLLLASQLPYEAGQALDRIEGRNQ